MEATSDSVVPGLGVVLARGLLYLVMGSTAAAVLWASIGVIFGYVGGGQR